MVSGVLGTEVRDGFMQTGTPKRLFCNVAAGGKSSEKKMSMQTLRSRPGVCC